jgi:hypothetical protein
MITELNKRPGSNRGLEEPLKEVRMTYSSITFTPNFIKINQLVEKFKGGRHTYRHTQHGNLKHLGLLFLLKRGKQTAEIRSDVMRIYAHTGEAHKALKHCNNNIDE